MTTSCPEACVALSSEHSRGRTCSLRGWSPKDQVLPQPVATSVEWWEWNKPLVSAHCSEPESKWKDWDFRKWGCAAGFGQRNHYREEEKMEKQSLLASKWCTPNLGQRSKGLPMARLWLWVQKRWPLLPRRRQTEGRWRQMMGNLILLQW